MTTNLRKQKTITAIFWSVMAVLLLAMGIYAIRDLPMQIGIKVSPNIHLAIEMSTDNSVYKTVFKNYGNETLDSNINRTIEDGNKITLTGDIFDNIYSNEPLYIRITNYTQTSDVAGDGITNPALYAKFTSDNGVINYPNYGVENIAPYDGTNTPSAKTFVVMPQSVIMDSNYKFNLKLEIKEYITQEYNVTQDLATGITSLNVYNSQTAPVGRDFITILSQDIDNLGIAIDYVKINNVVKLEGLGNDYTFNDTTGELKIFGSAIVSLGVGQVGTIDIKASVKSADIIVSVVDETKHGSYLTYNNNNYLNTQRFSAKTTEDFVALVVTNDEFCFVSLTINGDFTTNFTYANTTLIIAKSTLSGNVKITLYSYFTGIPATEFADGTGTQGDPYIIATPNQFYLISTLSAGGETFAGKYFELANDIYMSKYDFVLDEPSGLVRVNEMGTNNTICALGVHNTGTQYHTTQDIITGTGGVKTLVTRNNVGSGQVFYDNSCLTSNSLTTTSTPADLTIFTPIALFSGTFDGKNNSIKNVYANTALIQFLNGGELKNLNNKMGVSTGIIENDFKGSGFVNECNSNAIVNSCNNYSIISTSNCAGGIVNKTLSTAIIINCINYGFISGIKCSHTNACVGGILGLVNYGEGDSSTLLINNINYGKVKSYDAPSTGGITGYNRDSSTEIKNCVSTGSVTSATSEYLGNIIGFNNETYSAKLLSNYYIAGMATSGGVIKYGNGTISSDVAGQCTSYANTGTSANANCSDANKNAMLTSLNNYATSYPTVTVGGKTATLKHWVRDTNNVINKGFPYFE